MAVVQHLTDKLRGDFEFAGYFRQDSAITPKPQENMVRLGDFSLHEMTLSGLQMDYK